VIGADGSHELVARARNIIACVADNLASHTASHAINISVGSMLVKGYFGLGFLLKLRSRGQRMKNCAAVMNVVDDGCCYLLVVSHKLVGRKRTTAVIRRYCAGRHRTQA
jgi:hypothetical protein